MYILRIPVLLVVIYKHLHRIHIHITSLFYAFYVSCIRLMLLAAPLHCSFNSFTSVASPHPSGHSSFLQPLQSSRLHFYSFLQHPNYSSSSVLFVHGRSMIHSSQCIHIPNRKFSIPTYFSSSRLSSVVVVIPSSNYKEHKFLPCINIFTTSQNPLYIYTTSIDYSSFSNLLYLPT
ncbi:hypothetical protein J3R30DRAFT_2362861 [Lentinula aciculospora]|uniref:Uncharacterized protein n=1 Tax=Lentinula aciculospora TaxID=153920 RepID=A0A9W9AFE8_9AGAR|nr:hypothetical protein J3R30DRAFT_2362861 [Lentinula aciculospora]